MSARKWEQSTLSATLQTTILKSNKKNNKSKDKLNFLDSTAMTAKYSSTKKNDDTLDLPKGSISVIEPGQSFGHKHSRNMLPEIKQSMSEEYFATLSPKHIQMSPTLERQYERIQQFCTDDKISKFDKIPVGKVEMNPKKMERWICSALEEAIKEGFIVDQKVESKVSILKTFGIDRETFMKNDLDTESINRLYRALYVYSLGFHELVKEPLERSTNRHKTMDSIWKVYSILLQFVCKTEYSMIITKLTRAYQLDAIKLHETIDSDRSKFKREKNAFENKISDLEYDNTTLTNDLDELNAKNLIIQQENSRLKELVDEEGNARQHFEDKLKNVYDQLNDYKAQIKLNEEDLKKLTAEKREMKDTMQMQESSIVLLTQDKIKSEKQVEQSSSTVASLKEEILNGKTIIAQRNERLKLAIVELGDANKEIEHVKSTIADKDLRISVIQSKVMEKINEQDAIVAKLENTKRINMNYENQIKALSAKLTQQTENHQEFDLKYLSLVKVEKFLREDNILLKKTANESDKKAQVVESKFSGIDIKYKNLLQEFEAMQKDYKNSIKALEQVNKTRNAYFDELQVNAEKYKTLTIQKETVDHQLYNEKALFTNLQQRLKDVEVEFEDQTRKETANSELAVAQILNLEEKHMAMLNRYKKETLMKSNWAQSYQREYNERMKLEIENKQLLGNLNGQENRNLDLQSNNDELTDRIRDLERRLDLVKDEKYDLLCKIERKNNQLESHKLTMDNLESHNETYTRKLRKLTNERVLKEKHATEILQMEVEDLHSK